MTRIIPPLFGGSLLLLFSCSLPQEKPQPTTSPKEMAKYEKAEAQWIDSVQRGESSGGSGSGSGSGSSSSSSSSSSGGPLCNHLGDTNNHQQKTP